MFIELHFLQNFAPSNLNRDDTGNPKDTEFGGVRRARISSQAFKRAIRLHPIFEKTTEVKPAIRTRWLTRSLVDKLTKNGKPEDVAWKVAEALAKAFELGTEKDKKTERPRTSVLVFFSEQEIQALADQLAAAWKDVSSVDEKNVPPAFKKIADEFVKAYKTRRASVPDIAMFGRMLAEKPELKMDAACQVSHAISTHRVNMELDYFTAVDDLLKDDEAGAGHVNVTAFNSACFYRYARIDWDLLVKNLGGDKELAKKTVEGFLRAAALAIPTGKQNAFAAQNPPDFMLGVVRKDGQSWSLANAFETPVKPGREGGLMSASIQKLGEYWEKLNKAYGNGGMTTAALALDTPPANLPSETNMEAWTKKLLAALE